MHVRMGYATRLHTSNNQMEDPLGCSRSLTICRSYMSNIGRREWRFSVFHAINSANKSPGAIKKRPNFVKSTMA
ncbi:hypothetical protein PAECIP111802_02642 [Paenibacillus allorhizosphaerae]|uniref:Uncharacterized protein n=1 Tax=Paenibacillus allorhizosphaerae TaxID=2849866 RepID=A0ABM8VH00_9BACL|nr:hypothetical protein PAECIP111802_02642 [Paenibacillus allorhizosphaerae]